MGTGCVGVHIDYSDGELKEKVKALTDGKGADVIYEPVGGDLFEQCMRCVNWYGRILVIGFAAGDIPRVPINLILLKSCQVVGVFYGAWSARCRDEADANFKEILQQKTSDMDKIAMQAVGLTNNSDQMHVILGSTTIHNSQSFLQDLENLKPDLLNFEIA